MVYNQFLEIISDVMSIFDASTCRAVEMRGLVWFGNFFYVFMFMGLIFFLYSGRAVVLFGLFVSLPGFMVGESKLRVLGGGHLWLKSLFVTIFFVNMTGLVPYVISVRSHIVFSLCFGLSFWLSLVLSRLVAGKLHTSMSKLVFAGLPLVGGIVLCWIEKLSIFFRWFTLSLRLVANMTVGQIASASVRGLLFNSYFGMRSMYVFGGVLLIGVGLLMVELAVRFIQAYLFCLLLRAYRDDHSL